MVSTFELFKKHDILRVTIKKSCLKCWIQLDNRFKKFKIKDLLFQTVLDKHKFKIKKIFNSVNLINEEIDLKTKLFHIFDEFAAYLNNHVPLLFTFWTEVKYKSDINQ